MTTPPADPIPTPTIDRMLFETQALLERARAMVLGMQDSLERLPIGERMLVVRECSRLTGRLTAVLSWLMTQKGLAGGEIDPEGKLGSVRLFGAGDARLDPRMGDAVPERAACFSDLLRDSAELYERAARLDESAVGRKGGAPW